MSFQWDALLLETGLLAIFFAPSQFVSKKSLRLPVSPAVLWLLRWLLFRLMFESGCVKLFSGDPTWRNLTALNYHYETQPLPTWIGWYAHQSPAWFLKSCVAGMFTIELGLPFFIFGPLRLRVVACSGFLLLQVWILLTGNYGFFNYLTILLLLLLLDDAMLRRCLPSKWSERVSAHQPVRVDAPEGPEEQGSAPSEPRLCQRCDRCWSRWIAAPLTLVIVVVTAVQLSALFRWSPGWQRPARALADWLAPYRSINHYGLFAVMTTSRPEIVIEGSNDRETWRAYEFYYKPGLLKVRPPFVAPHQPRLDWQMWFAALGTYRENPWFINLCVRLLQGSPEVLALLAHNPFPNAPPRYLRAQVYDYHFTTPTLRSQDGAWWQRELRGEYLPVISLRDIR